MPQAADVVFAELRKRLSPSAVARVDAMSGSAPSADDLLGVLKTGGTSRYSDDVGYDMHDAAILAARSLGNDQYIANSEHASFALELLADRGVGIPHWDEAAIPPQVPQRIDEPANIAREVSKQGVNVLQVGFDAAGRLVRIAAVDGVLEPAVRESADSAAEEKFRQWAKQYPFEYGMDEETPNLFYVTTAGLVLPTLPKEGPVLVVADVRFQPFPPNLLYLNDELAGRVRPMAAAPSLLWLKSAWDRGATGDGRYCAWISTAVGGTGGRTLPMIAERLGPTFEENGFIFDNAPALPKSFAGASLAVVSAHRTGCRGCERA